MFHYIKDNMSFDQLIIEHVDDDRCPLWIHVSYVDNIKNRGEILIARKNSKNKTYYCKHTEGLHNEIYG